MFKRISKAVMKINFSMIILDEAQSIRNNYISLHSIIHQLNIPFRIGLSGTPIENHTLDILNILDFLNPGHFSTSKESEELLKNNELFDKQQVIALSKAITPFCTRVLKGDEIPEAFITTLFCKYRILFLI